MHTCIHAYMHTCIHAYMHTCIRACMHACMHTYIHTYIHTHTYMLYASALCIYLHTYMYYMIYAIQEFHAIICYMGVSILIVYSARAEMPNAQTWGVTVVFPELAANSYTPSRHIRQNCPQYIW